jgi:hypothetical protein
MLSAQWARFLHIAHDLCLYASIIRKILPFAVDDEPTWHVAAVKWLPLLFT